MQMLQLQNIELGKGRAGLLSYIMYDGIVSNQTDLNVQHVFFVFFIKMTHFKYNE